VAGSDTLRILGLVTVIVVTATTWQPKPWQAWTSERSILILLCTP
jgi:hypothetical protein